MAYRIDLAESAARQLAALPRRIRRLIRKEIFTLATDPRVIYEIEDRAHRVRVARIGHRSAVYDDRERL